MREVPGKEYFKNSGKPARTLRLKFVPISFLTDIILCESSIFDLIINTVLNICFILVIGGRIMNGEMTSRF
jgi:hypothetical protein